MKKLSLILLILLMTGCTTRSDLLRNKEAFTKEARKCVESGGIPLFYYEEGSFSQLTSISCIYRK